MTIIDRSIMTIIDRSIMENSTVIINRLIMATLRLLSIIGPSIWECNYYNLALGPIEIILPSGHIIPPLGCIILPSGRLDLRSTASLRQDNASRGRNNVAFWQDNFYCPSGLVVIISHYSTFFGATVLGEVLNICPYSSLGMDIEYWVVGGDQKTWNNDNMLSFAQQNLKYSLQTREKSSWKSLGFFSR